MNIIKANIPNTITCCNLVSGAVACIMAARFHEQIGVLEGYQWAFIAIALAAVFDFMDGAMARALKAYSNLGKELDSLSDLVSFGLAPALMVYYYMQPLAQAPWAFSALWIAVMGAVRLARFNCDDRQTTSFIGLPIPANALFWVGAIQLFITMGYPGTTVMVVLTLLFPLLMVSGLHLFSLKFKSLRLAENWHRYLLIVACIILLATLGIPGLAWTVIFYIVLALIVPSR